MTPERYRQIASLFHQAQELEPAQCATFLDRACAGDGALRRDVESLIASHDGADSFMDDSALEVAAGLLADSHVQSMIGRTLGRYQVLSLLGAGGMGEVYRARDLRLDRDVAIKMLPEHLATDAEALTRFQREAKALAALSHPNIMAIHDFGTDDDVPYAVMELLEGETLRSSLARSPLSWRRTAEIGAAVAEGLAAAHAKGIIHRDVKPENIFLTAAGEVKILDFGVARDTNTSSSPTADAGSRPGVLIGTPGYMAPEQVCGEVADARSDLFSLGCVLHEALTGQQPFARGTAADTMRAILTEDPPALHGRGRGIPNELDRLVRRCLEKSPGERYQSARDLAVDFRAVSSDAQTSRFRAGLTTLRLRGYPWAGAALVILTLAALTLAASVWLYRAVDRDTGIESMAVVPFVDTAADPSTGYLSEGIAESIANSLSRLGTLRIAPWSTRPRYKGTEVDPQAVGLALHVRAVLMVRVVPRGESLDVKTELVDVANVSKLWGEQYTRKLTDLLTIHEEIARQVSDKLRLGLSGEQRQQLAKRYTESVEAYRLYLKGRYYWNRRTDGALNKAIEHFREAIDKDPNYALAYAGLADAYGLFGFAQYGVMSQRESARRTEAAALKALELDDTLAEAHTALAGISHRFKWDWASAEKGYKRALALNPNYATAHHLYALYLASMRRHDEAIAAVRRARELDPLSLVINAAVGRQLYWARQYDQAAEELGKTIDMDPYFNVAHFHLGLVYEQTRQYARAIAELTNARTLSGDSPFRIAGLGHAYAMSGETGKALDLLAELKELSKRRYVSAYHRAVVYTGLGDLDQAFESLETAYGEREGALVLLKVEPMFDTLRSDPRFGDLIRRIGLPEPR